MAGVERPNGPLRRAYEASSPGQVARAAQLPPRPPAPSAAHDKQAVGQPQPWRNQNPRPSTTASPSSGSASTRSRALSQPIVPSTPASTASPRLWKGPRPRLEVGRALVRQVPATATLAEPAKPRRSRSRREWWQKSAATTKSPGAGAGVPPAAHHRRRVDGGGVEAASE